MSLKEQLQNLKETELRVKIVIPLMKLLRCSKVRDWHGTNEKGKDVLYVVNNVFKDKVYGAILLKNDGNVNKPEDLKDIQFQTTEAISKTFIDPDDAHATFQIHELVIMTSYNFTEDARDHMNTTFGKYFPSLYIVDGDKLVALIEKEIFEYNSNNPTNRYVFNLDTFSQFCEYYCRNEIYRTEGPFETTGTVEGSLIQ